MPLESSSCIQALREESRPFPLFLNLALKQKVKRLGHFICRECDILPKILFNLQSTYESLDCKEENIITFVITITN